MFTKIFVNPKIIVTNKKAKSDIEGCLSLKGLDVEVSRPKAIRVVYRDTNGKQQTLDLKGRHARVVRHETDHLDGALGS